MGPGQEAADCRIPRDPGASARSLMGDVRVQATLELLTPYCWVKPGPGVSARELV